MEGHIRHRRFVFGQTPIPSPTHALVYREWRTVTESGSRNTAGNFGARMRMSSQVGCRVVRFSRTGKIIGTFLILSVFSLKGNVIFVHNRIIPNRARFCVLNSITFARTSGLGLTGGEKRRESGGGDEHGCHSPSHSRLTGISRRLCLDYGTQFPTTFGPVWR